MTRLCALVAPPLALTTVLLGAPARAEDEASSGAARTDHFRVGAIAGIGFPRPLAVEGLALIEQRVAVGVEYGALPRVTVSGVEVSLWSVAGDVRVFPWRGKGFYVGLRAGRQHVGADTTVNVKPVGNVTENLSLDGWFLNPRLGFLIVDQSGFTFGLEAGVQIPIGATMTSSLPVSLDPSAASTASAIGNSVLPTVNLARLGALF